MGEGYSWAPPGLSPARVEEYMRQLPVDKVSLQSCSDMMLQYNVTADLHMLHYVVLQRHVLQ